MKHTSCPALYVQDSRQPTAVRWERPKKGSGQVDAACAHGLKTKPPRHRCTDEKNDNPTDRKPLAAPRTTAYSQVSTSSIDSPDAYVTYLAQEAFDDQRELLLLRVSIRLFHLKFLFFSVQLLLKSFRLRDSKISEEAEKRALHRMNHLPVSNAYYSAPVCLLAEIVPDDFCHR